MPTYRVEALTEEDWELLTTLGFDEYEIVPDPEQMLQGAEWSAIVDMCLGRSVRLRSPVDWPVELPGDNASRLDEVDRLITAGRWERLARTIYQSLIAQGAYS